MAFTNGFSFFNTNFANVKLCYFNQIGCIEIANVFDKFRGKKPKKGMVMYDYDNKGKFWLHIEDVLAISQNWEALVNGEYDFEKISEGGTREMTTKLTIGRGLYQVGEEKVKKSKAPFQISIESYDEYNEDDENNEPINSYVYSSADSDTEIKIFKIYIDILLQFVMSGLANHIAACSLQNNDRNGGGEYNKFSRTPRYSRNNKNDDDDDEDFSPTRNRNNGERSNKFNKRSKNNDSPDEEETFNEDDE